MLEQLERSDTLRTAQRSCFSAWDLLFQAQILTLFELARVLVRL
jgi:hypothetical protein